MPHTQVTAKRVVTPTNHLQTIYLESDPGPVHINSHNGLISIAVGPKIIIYRPLNEFMSKPQWLEAVEIVNELDDSKINAVHWSLSEDELIVGSDKTLTIYHLWDEFGSVSYNRRFCKRQPNPIDTIRINGSSAKIITLNQSNYDNLVKIWSRITFDDDDQSLFELAYLKHPPGSWIRSTKWRVRDSSSSSTTTLDGSMANIKNIRSYLDDEMNDNEVLYTLSDDFILRVWSTYEFSGHGHIKCWNHADLTLLCGFDGEDQIVNALILDNYYLQKILVPYLNTNSNDNFDFDFVLENNDYDICIVVSKLGYFNFLSISNINGHPPNSIKFKKINKVPLQANPNSFPSPPNYPKFDPESVDIDFLESEECSVLLSPIDIPNITMAHDTFISLLVHDRVKNTIRMDLFNFSSILSHNTKYVGNKLINKFQGHTKSIRQLITSSSSKKNILLSILNFPQHNYIWEPLVLNPKSNESMSLAKRFQLDVSQGHKSTGEECGIWDSVLINDVIKPVAISNGYGEQIPRHHLVVVCEKGGYLSFWNCNGLKGDDKAAVLLKRIEIIDSDSHKIWQEPKAFLCTKLLHNVYYVISIFEADLIRGWKLVVKEIDNDIEIEVDPWEIENLPVDEQIHKITTVHSNISNTLLSTIDEKGTLQIFSINSKCDVVRWNKTGKIHTNIPKATKIHGSSISNKFAVMDESKHKLTIWDIKSGLLEYEELFPEEYGAVRDLDWTVVESSSECSTNAILSVGFSRFVLLYTQLRYDYTNNMPTFAVLKKIDILDYTTHEIGDLVWMDNEFLVIGCGNQFFIDDKWVKLGSSNNSNIDYIIKQLMTGYSHESEGESTYEISHLTRILNGPLPVYHPQFLIQALFMDQIKLVHDILVRLFQCLRADETVEWDLNMNIANEVLAIKKIRRQSTTLTHSVFHDNNAGLGDIFTTFSADLLDLLIEKLTKISLPLLTRHQQITLLLVITIIKDLINSESVDKCGIRFLIGFKLFLTNLKQPKLTMRDINWGLHSDNREILLDSINLHYKNRINWPIVKQCGISYWVSDRATLISIVEKCARNEFGDTRDPSGITSVFFLAIKKKQILIGLWKTVSHPEKQKMLKFLSNNFNEPRWKSAALKNAFVLLGKHRYIDAAYFFLLADCVKDCCITLANKAEDIELAILVAKVYDDSANQETLTHLIENFILPKAIEQGNRWVTSWIFWEMNLKELSVQALIKSPISLVKENKEKFSESFVNNHLNKIKLNSATNSFLQDDPVLILLFDNLRRRKFNYLQGALSVEIAQETDFILKIASIYTRMGCDYLALLLIKDWQFIDHKTNEIETKTEESTNESNLFKEFKQPFSPTAQPTTFEEPDMMSAFDF